MTTLETAAVFHFIDISDLSRSQKLPDSQVLYIYFKFNLLTCCNFSNGTLASWSRNEVECCSPDAEEADSNLEATPPELLTLCLTIPLCCFFSKPANLFSCSFRSVAACWLPLLFSLWLPLLSKSLSVPPPPPYSGWLEEALPASNWVIILLALALLPDGPPPKEEALLSLGMLLAEVIEAAPGLTFWYSGSVAFSKASCLSNSLTNWVEDIQSSWLVAASFLGSAGWGWIRGWWWEWWSWSCCCCLWCWWRWWCCLLPKLYSSRLEDDMRDEDSRSESSKIWKREIGNVFSDGFANSQFNQISDH